MIVFYNVYMHEHWIIWFDTINILKIYDIEWQTMSHKIQIITMCTYNINWSWTCWRLEPKVAMVLVIIKAGVRVRWVSDYDAGWCIQVSFLYKGKSPILLWVSGVHWNPFKKKGLVIFIVMTKTSFFQRMYSMKNSIKIHKKI